MGKCWHLPDFVLILGSLSFFTITEAEKMPELPPLPPQLKSGYLFTMPQTLQAGAEEQFCLTLHGIVDDQVMTLSFHATDFALDAEYSHTYVNGVGQCNTFVVPNKPGRYEVTLSNATDVITNTVEIDVLGNNLITFVQTDKPIYKPGQKVKFRILTMMRNLRSRTGKIDNVFIIDPNNFRVKQFKAVESEGMASLEFQLVNEPKLGTWTIEVTVDEQITLQTFTVEEYVLPRFEVVITPPRYILSTSEEFEVSICAKYTYGKPVKGFLTMVICMRGYSSYDQPCALRREEINGCYQSSINASEIMTGRMMYYGGNTLTIQATVREAETGVEVNSSSEGPQLSYDPLKITLTDYTNGYFKPGLPVYGMVKVQNPDGSPAMNTDILITANDYKNDLYLAKTMTTNDDGEIVYSICQGIMENTSSLSLMAKAENYSESEYRRAPTGYGSMKQWFSPSLSYIQIPTIHNKVKCGENLQLNVPYTHSGSEPYIKFYYQVVSRGRIVYTGETNSPTFSNALDILEMNVDNCLQPSRPPTYTPPVPEPEPDSKVELSSNTSKISTDQETKGGESDSDEIEKDEDLSKSQESRSNSSEIDPNSEDESDIELEDDLPAIEPADFDASQRQSNLSLSSKNPDSEIRRKRSDMYYRHHNREQEIVRSEPISEQVSALELQIPIIAEMSPKFSLLLYYIRDDGETVADSMDFEVEQCFDNDVQMNFSDEMVLPGAEATLTLQAAPGSVCGIGIVDKSVNILGGDHQITPEKVFQKLAEYSHSSRGRYNFYQDDRDYCRQKLESKQKEKDTNSSEDDGDFPVFGHYYWYSSSYVDAIEAFKQMGLMVFTNLVLETRPCSVSEPVFYGYMMEPMRLGAGLPGPVGPAESVSLQAHEFKSLAVDSHRESKPADLRVYFPETWLWDIHLVGDSGTLELKKTLPHTITKWVGNSICIDDESGFGLSPVIGITVFQPFFLAFNLPYAAVRGERIPITITVFNYLDKCIHMLLTLDTMKNFHSFAENKNSLCLCGGQTHTRKYYITALEIGTLPISARAEIIPGMCSNEALMDTKYLGLTDAVQRQVLVKAEGVTQQYSHSVYMCAEGSQPEMEVIHLPLPDDIVPDSARGDIGVIGDIMGPALTNLDGLVRMPTGCGEQNMVGFTPNIYVLKYLTATNRLTEEIQDKAVNFMETGYQRELKYRHRDGSFSAFGEEGRKAGSSWLTAFVVKSFAQAQPFIFIDSSDLNISISYLKSVQMENGCFMERGQVLSSYMQGGLGSQKKDNVHNDAALSAYILIALLEAGLSRQDSVAVSAIECINNELQLNPDTDTYTLALAAYVNTLYNASSQQSLDIMKELNERAVSDGNVRYWKRAGEQPKPVNSWYYIAAMSAEVEMTAYALLATLQFYDEEAVTNSQPTAFWLSNQQSSSGGFSSTQDTVVGLNALSEFAGVAFSDVPTDLVVRVTGGGIEHNFEVTADNSLQLQKEQLVEMRNATLHVTATGTGCALLQANVRYNKVPVNLGIDNPKFFLKVEPRRYRYDTNRCDRRTLHISFSIRDQTDFPSGMTLITVRMVTSWYVVPDSLKELRSKFPLLGIQKFELDEKGLINFYFDQLDVRIRKFELDVEQNRDLAVSDPKPAEIQIYQYYEKDVTVIQTYTLKTTCGTKAEIPDNLPPDDNDNLFPAQRRENLGSVPFLGLGIIPAAKVHGCPICTYSTTPQDFAALVCNSTAALKAHSGRKANYLEIKADLRPRVKAQYNKLFVTVNLDEGCACDLLQPPAHTVIILTKSSNFKNTTLTTDDTTHIFDLKMDKNLERKARGAQRMCKLP